MLLSDGCSTARRITHSMTPRPTKKGSPNAGFLLIVRDKSALHQQPAAFAPFSLPARRYASVQHCLRQRLQMLPGELRVHRGQILLHQIGPLMRRLGEVLALQAAGKVKSRSLVGLKASSG